MELRPFSIGGKETLRTDIKAVGRALVPAERRGHLRVKLPLSS
jgi:hypothetical protein